MEISQVRKQLKSAIDQARAGSQQRRQRTSPIVSHFIYMIWQVLCILTGIAAKISHICALLMKKDEI